MEAFAEILRKAGMEYHPQFMFGEVFQRLRLLTFAAVDALRERSSG